MTEIRTKVTDATARLLTPSTKTGEVVRSSTAARTKVTEPEPRTLFVRPMPATGCECDVEIDDPVRAHLQDLVNEHSKHLCVCSPNRADMMAARAEMQAHPGYAEYKARRDAAMAAHSGNT
jgi:hypothetical protein